MSNFVDRVRISVKAGNGGCGSIAFHREKYIQNGGPDGGDGGRGGNIVLFADPNMNTLMDFRLHAKYFAENGADGTGNRCNGKNGADVTISVPVGTVVYDNETDRVLADMDEPRETRILFHGGRGGYGNVHFASSTRQAPNFAKPGGKTEAHTLRLELKTIADVGLVGYPNVGKSTILSVITSANPKIGNYHFTTITPNLGIIRRYGRDIVVADIPGLIEGASEGAGLGHYFLRHVERTRLLLHVLDISGSEDRDPLEDYDHINTELENYGDLKNRPQIIVCNKTDLPGWEENLERLKARTAGKDIRIFPVSAATHRGFDELLDEITRKMDELPPILHYAEEAAEVTVPESGWDIVFDGKIYEVRGSGMAALLESVNFDDYESLNWFHRSLRRLGVIEALRKAGAEEGSTVRIGEMEFDFID